MANRFVFTISELTRHIRDTIESAYPDVWVEGEISNLRVPSSGHCYFTLKDEGAQLRCVMFRMQARLLRFVPEDGLKVICRGRINVYEARGEYQLVADMMEPKGVGDLQLAFEQLKQKLQQEGLFEPGRKKALPFLPARVAVVTSPTGAAVRDIIRVMHRRFPNVGILVVPVKVQGEEAPAEIAGAIELVNRHGLADVIIAGRGGGSLEDLWAFNTEIVARAIAGSGIPVVSAVGHETDMTIADFAADLRAPTPSAAAELVVREKRELAELLRQHRQRLGRGIARQCSSARSNIGASSSRLRSPGRLIAGLLLRLDDLHGRMTACLPRLVQYRRAEIVSAWRIIASRSPAGRIGAYRQAAAFQERRVAGSLAALKARKRAGLQALAASLSALNPAGILARGYSITRRLPGLEVVRSSAGVEPGRAVRVSLGNGEIDCIVEKIVK